MAARGRKMEAVCEALSGSAGSWADDWLNELATKADAALSS